MSIYAIVTAKLACNSGRELFLKKTCLIFNKMKIIFCNTLNMICELITQLM